MYAGKIVFAQLIDHLPRHAFRRCIQRYGGHYKVQSFSCLDKYLCMTFAQLTYRESLRDIEACLRAVRSASRRSARHRKRRAGAAGGKNRPGPPRVGHIGAAGCPGSYWATLARHLGSGGPAGRRAPRLPGRADLPAPADAGFAKAGLPP